MTDEHPERRSPRNPARDTATDVAAGLDAPHPRAARWPGPAAPGIRLAAALAGRPLAVARRSAGLAAELARIGLGRSALAPAADDPRYAHPAWRENPVLRRAVQVHLAASATAQELVGDARLDRADEEHVRAAVDAVADALAPSNTPLNPAAWRAVTDSGGPSAVVGARRLVTDLAATPRVPATVEPGAFDVGTDVAATPGAVVLRTPVFELLQYLPQTETVLDVPLVVVPPVRGRYYLADLAPDRSIVEHLVRGGQQVFAVSWRNPDASHAGWDLDTYGHAVLDAMDAAEHIARTPRTSLMAFGSGGTITAMLLAHLAAIGAQERVASVTFAATVLDRKDTGADQAAAMAALGASERTGLLDGRRLGHELARLAPEAFVWPYWVRSYLSGEPPPASDVQFWNADTTRVPTGLHRDLVDVALRGALAVPGATSLLGTPLDLAKVDRDCYVVAGAGDRAAPWPDVYRTTRLLGGSSRFVLADGGQLASLVSPPGDTSASFRSAAPATSATTAGGPPHGWIALTAAEHGSWWDDHLRWLTARTGPLRDAPPELGGRGLHALAPAPGDYVLAP
jgi:polyhydroxyalkanoate synthase subunit PhaC